MQSNMQSNYRYSAAPGKLIVHAAALRTGHEGKQTRWQLYTHCTTRVCTRTHAHTVWHLLVCCVASCGRLQQCCGRLAAQQLVLRVWWAVLLLDASNARLNQASVRPHFWTVSFSRTVCVNNVYGCTFPCGACVWLLMSVTAVVTVSRLTSWPWLWNCFV